jgi:hypothetical protein
VGWLFWPCGEDGAAAQSINAANAQQQLRRNETGNTL